LASDALLSETAHSFLEQLTPANRALWDNQLRDQFIANPVNESTIWYSESGYPDAQATVIGPFLVIWRQLNAEVVAVGTIRWS
jgi:hypothetical protein